MLVCQLVLYLIACTWKFESLFQNYHKDFTNQQGHTCIILNRCCPHVCIPLCVRTFTKHYLNLELQLCFTSGLFFKATEDLLGLAWSRLESTNTSSSESCTAVSVWSTTDVKEQLLPTLLASCITVLGDAGMDFLQGWELWHRVSALGRGRQHSLMHASIETNCFSTEWASWTCSHENQHMLSPQLAPFSRDGLLSRHQDYEQQCCLAPW